MSNSDQLAFLPSINETVMDELRTTEGMLFRDENAKKLFLDAKDLLIESMYSAYKNFKGEMYQSVLDKYRYWEPYVEAEEMSRMKLNFKEIETRLLPVTIFYAKFLFNQDDVINIRKPKVETFLKGMFTRLAKYPHVRSCTFFEMDPLKQDFVIRDIFRQTLSNDCIQIVMKQEIHVIDDEKQYLNNVQEEKYIKEIEEVFPDDSISVLLEKQEKEEAAKKVSSSPLEKQEEKDEDTQSVISKVSKTSRATTKCKLPVILPSKTVHIDNEDDVTTTSKKEI